MRSLLRLALFAAVAVSTLPATSVSYSVINLNTLNGNNQPLYRYVYDLIGVPLGLNQELEIRFEVTQFAALSNGVAPSGFDLLLFQPNNPPGANGTYSLFAPVANLSMIGPFSVDVAYIGSGTPGSQQYFVNQLDSQGVFQSQLSSGVTETPEPGTLFLGLTGLAMAYVARRRLRT